MDFDGTTYKDPPDNRVLTVKFHQYLGAIGGRGDYGHTTLWTGPDQGEVDRLISKYGDCPSLI